MLDLLARKLPAKCVSLSVSPLLHTPLPAISALHSPFLLIVPTLVVLAPDIEPNTNTENERGGDGNCSRPKDPESRSYRRAPGTRGVCPVVPVEKRHGEEGL